MLNFEFDSITGKPKFYGWDYANEKRFLIGELNEAPVALVVDGAESQVDYVSTWVDVHDDIAGVEAEKSLLRFTPTFVAPTEHDPVIIGSVDSKMRLHELRVGVPFTIDIHLPHALLPRKLAEAYLASPRGAADDDVIEAWFVKHRYPVGGGVPVLAWHQELAEARDAPAG